MKKRVASLIMCISVCMFVLLGCGSDASSGVGSEEKGENATTDNQAEEMENSGFKIGFAMKTLDNPYFISLVDAVENLATEEGWKCTTLNANMDSTKEAENMETFITQGMDLIFLDSVDPTACVPSINAAAAADIPVVNLDSGVAESEQCTTVYSDNYQNGRMVGIAYGKSVSVEQEIIGVMVSSLKGNVACTERRTGLYCGIIESRTGCSEDEAWEEAEKFEKEVADSGAATHQVANFTIRGQGWGDATRQQALEASEDLITANKDLTCVLGDAAENLLGAKKALENAGIEGVDLICASDGPLEVLDLIKEGEFFGTGENSPWMISEKGMEIAKEILVEGKDWRSYPEVIRTEAIAITKENVDERYEFGY